MIKYPKLIHSKIYILMKSHLKGKKCIVARVPARTTHMYSHKLWHYTAVLR
jgi:hypothetical protein